MQAAINPTILFPPLYSIFPEDKKDAPTNDQTIACLLYTSFMYDIMLYNCIAHTLHIYPDRDSWQLDKTS